MDVFKDAYTKLKYSVIFHWVEVNHAYNFHDKENDLSIVMWADVFVVSIDRIRIIKQITIIYIKKYNIAFSTKRIGPCPSSVVKKQLEREENRKMFAHERPMIISPYEQALSLLIKLYGMI